MLGQPVTDIAQRVGVARQIDAVAQRRGGFGTGGDDGEVEDRERNHGAKLVCDIGRTKGRLAQIRRASGSAEARGLKPARWDDIIVTSHYLMLPIHGSGQP
jgi:hypothetical protein